MKTPARKLKKMSKPFKCALWGVGVLNLFLIAPLILLLTTNVPRIVDVDVLAEAPIAVKIGAMVDGKAVYERVKASSGSKAVQRISLSLPCDFPTDGFIVSADDAAVVRVFLRRNFIWGREYDCTKENGIWSCTAHGPFLPVMSWICWCALVFCELLLLGVSLFFATRCKPEDAKGSGFVFSVAVAALASGFVALVIPLQSFVSNRALFKFPTSDFICEASLAWFAGFCVLWVGLMASRRALGFFLHSLVIGFVVYEYLQTGILAIGEPEINGEVTYYMNNSLAVRDMVVLCVAMSVFVLGYRWIKPYLKWIVLVLFVMIGASLLDVKKDRHENTVPSPLSDGFCSKFDVAQNTVHSGQRNVMLMILDSVGTEVSLDVLSECPEFKEVFSGFVAFTNNIGVHDFTEPSVPAIMTGKLFDRGTEDGTAFQDYGSSALGSESFLCDYRIAGIPVSFLPGSFMFGYSSRKGDDRVHADGELVGSVFDYRPDTTPPLSLFETARFRLMPFAAKYRTLLMTFVGTKSHASVKDEAALYPMLAAAPVDMDLPNNLEIFHTDGAHSPFNVDRNGNQTSVVRKDYAGHLDRAIWVFKNLAKLFEAYKGNGIYDKSFIVVTADHGWMARNPSPDPDALYFRAPTMLWVKPIGASGELSFSKESTWHLNIKALMSAAMMNDLTAAESAAMLRSDDRIFRQVNRHGYREWHVDASGNSICTRK